MFEQAVQVSEGLQQAARQGGPALIPALSGCRACRTAQMIAAPVLGPCKTCGAELSVLSRTSLHGTDPVDVPGALAA